MKEEIVVTTTSFAKYDRTPLTLLDEKGFHLILNPYGRRLNKNELVELSKDAVGIIAGTEQIDASVLESLPKLKVISRCGIGIDNIDLDATKRRGIKVLSTPDAPTIAVAELTVGLILNLLRKINHMDTLMKNWKWEKVMGSLLFGKKVGIIGFGRIGKKVSELLAPFDCEVRYYDIRTEDEGQRTEAKGFRTDFESLLKISDIVSIHVSLKERIIGENEIRIMKKGAWLVNASRGGVVDENALYEALKEGYLAGAALDVFEDEPYTGPLRKLDNVILTPHIGSYALEARVKMERQAVENLLKGLEEGQ